MKNAIFKMIHIALLILGFATISHTMDFSSSSDSSDDYTNISLDMSDSITEQQKSYGTNIKQKSQGVAPENENYEEIIELQPDENNYHIPEAKSTLGFLCGRSQCLYYQGKHPNHDCCNFYCAPGCCTMTPKRGGASYYCDPTIRPTDIPKCKMCWLTSLGCPLFNGIFGIAPTGCTANVFTQLSLYAFSPLLTTASLSCCCITHFLSGYISYRYGDQEFLDSYERGLLCLPEDLCSCTSCTRISYSDHEDNCLSMICCCFDFWKDRFCC